MNRSAELALAICLGGLLLVPLADQAVKYWLRRRLCGGAWPLGPLGAVRLVPARIWLRRRGGPPGVAGLWTVWSLCTLSLVTFSLAAPGYAWCAALLGGGALSHALETTQRDEVSDYICLRFWPAFNAADVAMTAGASGFAVRLFVALTGPG